MGKIRRTGIDILGDVPWGTHFCQFYRTKEDLIDTLVPYFKAGLEDKEFCIWVTSEPLDEKEAKEVMKKAMPDFGRYLKKRQIKITSYAEWYLKDGVFNLQRVLDAWTNELNQALTKGYDGMRVTGNTFWLEKRDWRNFAEYEAAVNSIIDKSQMIAICTYPIVKCGAFEILDVAHNHQFTLLKRKGKWETINGSERKRAEKEIRMSERKYRALYETIRDGISASDLDGHIIECNQACADMLGYSKDELKNLTYKRLTPKKWHQMESKIVKKQVMRTGYSGEYEKEYIRKDGTVFPVSIRIWLIRGEDGKPEGTWCIAKDITERKKMEEERIKAETVRQQMEELNRFAKQLKYKHKKSSKSR